VPAAAADGTRLQACADGACEVLVKQGSKINLNKSLGLYALTVRTIRNDEIGLSAGVRGAGAKVACDGDNRCKVSVRADNGRTSAGFTAHPGAQVLVAKLDVKVVAVSGGEAVLRLTVSDPG
jgi:hypothetical protein